MLEWRFDQGRLEYFQFDEIKKTASALTEMDGMEKPEGGRLDTVREILRQHSSLPFAVPATHTVWRNYSRVFKCQLLATEINGYILATDLCKELASKPEEIDPDDYLAHFAKNFYYSSPIFRGYSASGPQIFPVVAIIKYLISTYLTHNRTYITLAEITEFLIANSVTGLEDFSFYSKIRKKTLVLSKDAFRQLRELVKFISQFSFLKWENPKLVLEVFNKEELYAIEKSLSPVQNIRKANADEEILQMGSGISSNTLGNLTLHNIESTEEEFTEGKKVRVSHLRSERSAKLKSFYFAKTEHPELCRMCEMDTAKKYPWTPHVIELHHLLPLASPVRVDKGTTSIKDLVGLCPSCHRATHRYYSVWFKKNKVNDFSNYEQAVAVYEEAKAKIVVV